LIETSAERVRAGAALVEDAGERMKEIDTSVRRVTDIMGEISAASAEQQTGIEQVAQAVTQMDEVTQQNAALVEEAAAAAQSLEEQARDLKTTVAAFKLADDVVLLDGEPTMPRREKHVVGIAAQRPPLLAGY
jgi:methyl-accepting chemotaxis protein